MILMTSVHNARPFTLGPSALQRDYTLREIMNTLHQRTCRPQTAFTLI